jgi:hypothetical protein
MHPIMPSPRSTRSITSASEPITLGARGAFLHSAIDDVVEAPVVSRTTDDRPSEIRSREGRPRSAQDLGWASVKSEADLPKVNLQSKSARRRPPVMKIPSQFPTTSKRFMNGCPILGVLVLALLATAGTPTAVGTDGGESVASATLSSAAPIRECGDYPGGPGAGVFNITTRVTTCRVARRMARRFWHGGWNNVRSNGRPFRRGAYTCRNRNIGYEAADLRCTASRGRVVHWQHGA